MLENFGLDKKRVIVETIERMTSENEYISEIELNGPKLILYKERGQRKEAPLAIDTEQEYHEAIAYLIEHSGLKSNDFLVEGRYNLSGDRFGRLHIAMPPVTPLPLVTLALKTTSLKDLTSIQGSGSFNSDISLFLKAAIGSKLTTVISGGTGAGKTTFLEALTNEFNKMERIGVCEDTPELLLNMNNVAYLCSTVRVPGMRDEDVADLAWIVKQINRMRVDRIIIGETRGKEFFDFVIGANSGKPGSITTIHANDGPAAMKKMATFVYMSVDIQPRIINEMISEAIDLVIQLGVNKKTGAHKILGIYEVTNAISSGDSPTIALNPLFSYDHESNTWSKRYPTDALKAKLEAHGYDPNSYTKIVQKGELSESGGLPNYFKLGRE